jgi:YVTN family beta-propeller protein
MVKRQNANEGTSSAPETPKNIAVAECAIATMTVPGYVDFLATDGRDAWVTNEGRVEKLKIGSSSPVASVSIPKPCGAMVVAFNSLWVASCEDSSLYRVSLDSQKIIAKIPTGLADPDGELSLADGAGSIWVLSDARGVLSRIDAASNKVVAQIKVMPNSCAAAFAYGAVWITSSGLEGGSSAGFVQRIDPETNQVKATIPVGPGPRFLAAGEGGVWTLNWTDGSVTRIDPEINQAVITIPLGMEGGGGDIATGGGKVWVRGTKVLLATIDPKTNRVSSIYGPPAGSGAVRVAVDFVWVTAHDTNTVWVLQAG